MNGERHFGKQASLTINCKTLRRMLDEDRQGAYLLTSHLPKAGFVLMEVEVEGKDSEIIEICDGTGLKQL